MTEKLIVRNFAGIKEIELEVRAINILIGPQASGKSVCAKLLFYFKNFFWKISSVIENEQTQDDLDSGYCRTFKEYFPPESWGDGEFLVRYEIADIFIEISREKEDQAKITLNYSDFFRKELEKIGNFLREQKEKREQEQKIRESNPRSIPIGEMEYRPYYYFFTGESLNDLLRKSFSTSLGQKATFHQIFIPAGRSFFAMLQSNIFSFLSSGNPLDPFLINFGSIYERVKGLTFSIMFHNFENVMPEIDRLIEKSLCGKYIRKKNEDFLQMEDGRLISVANSSSGQQEILPLTIILPALTSLAYFGSEETVYIEEPEAHLFPNAQRNIIELIGTVFNYDREKLQFFITTHSPYVLTSINNLLQAGILYQDASPEILSKLEEIIPKYKVLYPDDLSVYVLDNGQCESIIDPETGLINASIIDSVSEDLAIEFDQLLDLI